MVKIKSWGGAALVAAFLLLAVQNAAGFEIVDPAPKALYIAEDGTHTAVNPFSVQAPQDAERSPITYILVRMDNGVLQYIPQTFSIAPLEGYDIELTTDCSSQSECQSEADSYCRRWFSAIAVDASCDTSTGVCSASCEKRGSLCTRDSDCDRDADCGYCIISDYDCVDGQCEYAQCGSATECGMGCSSDSEAINTCMDLYDDSHKTVESAECRNGEPVCVTMPRRDIECTSNSDCRSLAEGYCEYGVSSYTCNKEYNCVDDIAWATCAWNCQNKPAPTYICGDKVCNGGETIQSCPQDCDDNNDPPSACPNGDCESGEDEFNCPQDCGSRIADTCTPGYISEPECKGNDVVRTYQYASCITEVREQDSCVVGCQNGVCLENDPDPDSYCGDGTCNLDETPLTCSGDCGEPDDDDYYCGDDICRGIETKTSCPEDCGNGGGIAPPDDNTIIIIGIVVGISVLALILLYTQKKK